LTEARGRSGARRSRQRAIVVGAGIVGLAVSLRLLERNPGLRVTVLEKEMQIAAHQTSHNSGVVHRGLYYRPGSINAALVAAGADRLLRFCDQFGVSYDVCGKLVVAVDRTELGRLDEIERRARANGVPGLEVVGPERIAEIEPLATGVRALYSPATAITDYGDVARALARQVEQAGGDIVVGVRVERVESSGRVATVFSNAGEFHGALAVTCAGLQSDRLIEGSDPESKRELKIVPFRGSYRLLAPRLARQVRGMIYPVPDPRFPFLGVHATRRLDGSVWIGPNAVLALAREGYARRAFSMRDTWESLTYPGFWRLASRYWRAGVSELWRDIRPPSFLQQLQRLMPNVSGDDLVPGPSGIRAQALARDGSLLDDFAIRQVERAVHVLNAPSPAATASLAIGDLVADRARGVLGRLQP
jgi:L-2-hydroxyglutarate oxidase LhgO